MSICVWLALKKYTWTIVVQTLFCTCTVYYVVLLNDNDSSHGNHLFNYFIASETK